MPAPPATDKLYVEMMPSKDAASDLKKISGMLESQARLSDKNDMSRYALFALWCLFRIAYESAKEKAESVVDIMVPWEHSTHLPSFPSLIADAQAFADAHPEIGIAGLIAHSFGEWTSLLHEEADCICGSHTPRKVPIDIMMRNIIKWNPEKTEFLLASYVGIRSQDKNHLRMHFEFSAEDYKKAGDFLRMDTGSEYLRAICSFENEMCFSDGQFRCITKKNIVPKNFNFFALAGYAYGLAEKEKGTQ